MEFNLSLKTGRKKSVEKSTRVATFRSNQPMPELTADGWFYPIDLLNDSSHYRALIDMYETLPEVQIPVNYLIDKMAIIRFNHIKMIGNDKEEIVSDSYVKDVLKTPNQYMNKSDFIKTFFLNRIVLGVGYINPIVPFGFDKPSQLYVLPSASTKPDIKVINKRDPRQNEIEGYTVNFGEGDIHLKKEEVVVQYEANLCLKLTEIKSRLVSAILTSESLRYNYEARVKIYRDRGALGVLAPKDSAVALNKEQADIVRDQYYEENGITGNKAPFMVAPRALSYTSIGFNVDELKLNENKLQDFNTICNVLSIDPALFDNTRATYNNKMLAKRNFWEDVGIPQFNSFLELLGNVFNLPSDEKLKADYSDIPALQVDLKTKIEANTTAYQAGGITHAEYRETLNREGGEDKYISEMQVDNQSGSGQNNEE